MARLSISKKILAENPDYNNVFQKRKKKRSLKTLRQLPKAIAKLGPFQTARIVGTYLYANHLAKRRAKSILNSGKDTWPKIHSTKFRKRRM